MTEIKPAWDEVADSVTQLGKLLRVHFDDVVAERDPDRKGLDEAFAQLRTTLDRAYSAAGQAAKDPAVRENATKVGSSFVDALSTTFTEVGQRMKNRGHQ
jgi:hypothetical protein